MSEKIPENVVAHLQECSAMVGRYEDEAFNQNVWWNLEDFKSPIEQLFYTAICTIRRLSDYKCHDHGIHDDIKMEELLSMSAWTAFTPTCVWPQFQVGKYKVDFMVAVQWHHPKDLYYKEAEKVRMVLVELDGHHWHDRSEKDRRYEKRRDRFLQSKGYRVMRFTGKEIVESPFLAASEVMASVSNQKVESYMELIEDYKA